MRRDGGGSGRRRVKKRKDGLGEIEGFGVEQRRRSNVLSDHNVPCAWTGIANKYVDGSFSGILACWTHAKESCPPF